MIDAKVKRFAPWFGANVALAPSVGYQLGKLDWCGVPFCGGCAELPHIQARGGIAADLHHHIINMARVVRDQDKKAALVDRLDGILFHPVELAAAQARCRDREHATGISLFSSHGNIVDDDGDVQWAADYFVCCWMGRGGHAGKGTEFGQGLAMRWTSSGGDSAKRLRSAIECLEAWHLSLRVWSFARLDCFEFLRSFKDEVGHGLYIDAPWPDAGKEYKHRFSDADQKRLAAELGAIKKGRVVIRFNDHPFIRELYPASRWTWLKQTSRNQRNNEVSEVLIINGPSYEPSPPCSP